MGTLLDIARKIQILERRTTSLILVVDNKPSTERRVYTPKANPTSAEIVEAVATVGAIWRNPFPQGSADARTESLLQVITAIWNPIFQRVTDMWPMGFISTDAINEAEAELSLIQQEVLKGNATLEDFRRAAETFGQICCDTTRARKN